MFLQNIPHHTCCIKFQNSSSTTLSTSHPCNLNIQKGCQKLFNHILSSLKFIWTGWVYSGFMFWFQIWFQYRTLPGERHTVMTSTHVSLKWDKRNFATFPVPTSGQNLTSIDEISSKLHICKAYCGQTNVLTDNFNPQAKVSTLHTIW